MTTQPTLSKLSMPRLANVYFRKRLFERLDEAKQTEIVWLSAPAGSGKTTLITSYIKDRQLPALWYQLDEGDNDLASFIYFMSHQPTIQRQPPLPLLVPEYLGNLSLFLRNYFRAFFSLLTSPSLLVFDNFQEIAEDSLLNTLLPAALNEVPTGISVVFISRSAPPPHFSYLLANGNLSLFDADDIQLSKAESILLGKLRYGPEISRKQLKAIYHLTRGWVAGQILLLEQMRHGTHLPDFKLNSNLQTVFDYFASEIFDRSEPEIQGFLLRTALLKKLTPLAAKELSESHRAEFILETLNKSNLFTAKHNVPEVMYEYHPLFRTFLIARLHQSFAPDFIYRLQCKTADILANSDNINDAINLLIAIGDWDKSIVIILKNAQTYAEHGMGQTLKKWLTAIPRQQVDTQPWCLYWLGQCHLPMDFDAARQYLERSYTIFKNTNDVTGLCLAWNGIVESYIYQWGDFKPLDRWIAEMDDLLKQHLQFPSNDIEIKVVGGFFSAIIYRCPAHPQREYWLHKLEQYMIESDNLFLRTQIANHLILYYSWCDLNLTKAATLIKQLETPIQHNSDMPPFIRIIRHAIQAIYHWNAGETQLSEENARQGLAIGEETGVQAWNFMLLAQVTWAKLTSGDIAGGEQTLDIMAGLLDTQRFLDAAHYHYQRFVVAFQKNDVRAMLEHAQLASNYADMAGSPWAAALTLTATGQAHYANGDKQSALDCVAQVKHYGKSFRSSNTLFQALMHEAEMELDSSPGPASTEKLQQALSFCRIKGWLNWPWWSQRIVSRLLIKALENDIEVDYVQRLIKKRDFVPDTIPVHLENWPWHCRIYTLGHFKVLIDDQPLQFSGKSQKRPLELLRALISLGGRDVNVNQLIDCIWPDSEADAAHAAFNMALKRLRTLLGDHQAIMLSEGILDLNPNYCWVDAWAFEQITEQHTNDPYQTQKALTLYQGLLFSSEACLGWCLPMRQRLHRRYLATTLNLGQYWEMQQRWQLAVDHYLRGLEVDEMAEAFYQRLMVCYKKQGLINEARRVYEQYLALFTTYQHMQPSEALRQTYLSL